MKKLLLFTTLLLSTITLLGCEDSKEDQKEDPKIYTLTDVYESLELYSDHLEQLTETQTELNEKGNTHINMSFMNDDVYTTYTRAFLIDNLIPYEQSPWEGEYMLFLTNAKRTLDKVRDNIADDLDKDVGESFQPNPEMDFITYRFLFTQEGYLLIDISIRGRLSMLKIGIHDNLIEINELGYSFDQQDLDLDGNPKMKYNYTEFNEASSSLMTSNTNSNLVIGFTSIEEQVNTVLRKNNDEYFLNYYNMDINTFIGLRTENELIKTENYIVYDNYGMLYVVSNSLQEAGFVKLSTNFIEATGYDIVKVSDNGGDTPDEGIYKEDGTPIYKGYLNFDISEDYLFGSVKQIISEDDLSDEYFNLNSLGLDLDNEKCTLEYFNSIRVTNLEDIKDKFTYNDYDLFGNDLENFLLDLIDSDIRNNLRESNDSE